MMLCSKMDLYKLMLQGVPTCFGIVQPKPYHLTLREQICDLAWLLCSKAQLGEALSF